MALFRRTAVPDAVKAVQLGPGERRAAWGITPDGQPVVAGTRALYLPDGTTLAWDEIERAHWEKPALQLIELTEQEGSGRRHEVVLDLDQDTDLPEEVRTRRQWELRVVLPREAAAGGRRAHRRAAPRGHGGARLAARLRPRHGSARPRTARAGGAGARRRPPRDRMRRNPLDPTSETVQVENVLAARGLVKSYRRGRAVDGIDLTVGAGERVAVLGPNGAGKTTTLLMCLGVVQPDAGEVTVAGYRLPKQRSKAMTRVASRPATCRCQSGSGS